MYRLYAPGRTLTKIGGLTWALEMMRDGRPPAHTRHGYNSLLEAATYRSPWADPLHALACRGSHNNHNTQAPGNLLIRAMHSSAVCRWEGAVHSRCAVGV